MLFSFWLWSISRPGSTGTPHVDLSGDQEAAVSAENLTPRQVIIERVITKTFKHYHIPLDISDNIRDSFRIKLWRMGKEFSQQGSKGRQAQLAKWKGDNAWKLTISEVEINDQILHRKRSLKEFEELSKDLEEESSKRMCLEQKVEVLETTVRQQSSIISRSGLQVRAARRKPFTECSRQQKHNRKKQMVDRVHDSLSICQADGYDLCSFQVKSRDTGECETFAVREQRIVPKNYCTAESDKLGVSLLIKDKYAVSNEAYHELSIMSDLPSFSQVRKLTKSMNSKLKITSCPNGVCGVQQSIRERILQRLQYFIHKNTDRGVSTPDTIRIKLTGDGTQIGRELKVVNIAFTILDEGETAQSVNGNYSIAIVKTGESYDDLANALQDICREAKDLEVLTVDDKVYKLQFFLGGDLKFLAIICGIDAANAEHACVWCECPKNNRSNMEEQWSLTDTEKGARTIQGITEKSKLGKKNKNRCNCSHEPLFPFIPIARVVVDSLHMFLRISDHLTDLLIRDLRIHDTEKTFEETYEKFLNEVCKVRFKWKQSKNNKETQYRDLTGPEKIRVFENINIPLLFPFLPNKEKLQTLWSTFYQLMKEIDKKDCDADKIDVDTKSWVTSFTSLYQKKDVTPYMHCFAMHTCEFVRLYGNIVTFTQQGLEKLNDLTTKQFQRSTNHRGTSALKQILEKRNRLEILQDQGLERHVLEQVCSVCKLPGHNKRTCKHALADV